MTRLTIFTAPKAFRDLHIALIQTNAIRSWRQWGKEVDVLVIGQEDGLSEAAAGLGVRHLPDVQRNAQGTPLVSSIFELAYQNSTTGLLAYVNADILLLPDFLERAAQIAAQVEKFLVVGQRWDLDVKTSLDFSPGWQAALWQDTMERGRLHPPAGSDYFIFSRGCFDDMPAFAIGRAGWDNWMIFQARVQGWPVIDATGSINIIHQDHDYSHLPGSQSHYRLPETLENIRLAGGRRAIFSLADADWTINDGRLLRRPLRGARLLREIETYPLVKLKSGWLAEMFFAISHPKKAWGELRGRLAYKLGVGGS